jgi:hypothetical protein
LDERQNPIKFFIFEYWGVESILVSLRTAATPGLLYLRLLIVMMEKLMEWTVLAGETEALEENLPRRGGKPATNSFSYGAASY